PKRVLRIEVALLRVCVGAPAAGRRRDCLSEEPPQESHTQSYSKGAGARLPARRPMPIQFAGMTDRIASLPRLGVGISGEFGSNAKGIDVVGFREAAPDLIHFYEYGSDVERGLDEHVLRWAAEGLPTTYHFLDINLAEREDVD